MKPRSCELCGARASIYCESDSAFLCAECDNQVHAANFLAARHVRTPIDSTCSSSWFGPSSDSEEADDTASSSVRSAASSCVSTAESAPAASVTASRNTRKPRSSRTPKSSFIAKATAASTGEVDPRAEGILNAWCARLETTGGGVGLTGTTSNCSAVVAAHAMGVGLRRFGAAVPPRICAAAAVWFAFKLCRSEGGLDQKIAGHQYLRRLEDCSGVPARIIAAAESRLSRLVRSRQRDDAEGWAEC